MKAKSILTAMLAGLLFGGSVGVRVARGQKPPLLAEKEVAALANELSGETAKRNLEVLATYHRQRGSRGFHAAAELVAARLREYGLSDVAILEFPADGKIFYGTQRSRPPWDAEVGELEIYAFAQGGIVPCGPGQNTNIIATCVSNPLLLHESFGAEPVVLAEDSESADVVAELVDVGEGTKESDYAGKDVKGKIVLVAASPGAAQELAVGKFGAVGMVSYQQNQKNAWWGEDENLIRWGHLETFSEHKTFAFMVSLKTAREMRERLARGEKITLHAVVKAGQHSGNYEVVTATIPGADPKLKDEEIAFSCHLDHQRPGANDNASGCVTILEVARVLSKLTREPTAGGCKDSQTKPAAKAAADKKRADLLKELGESPGNYGEWLKEDCDVLAGDGKLARPARTIRFIFPPEIEGTLALLNGHGFIENEREHAWQPGEPPKELLARKPFELDLSKRIKTVVHMDMVGGGPATKAVFHVTRGPMSLPSCVHDVAWAFAEWVNEESYKFAATGKADYPFVAPEGGKEPLLAQYSAYTMGSDHDVYQDSSFGIPAIYMNDWPDRYIHTNFDTAANIDTTKLKRAAFIGAASGYFLAGMHSKDIEQIDPLLSAHWLMRAAESSSRERSFKSKYDRCAQRVGSGIGGIEALELWNSMYRFLGTEPPPRTTKYTTTDSDCRQWFSGWGQGDGALRFKRRPEPKGPLAVFGYDYFADHVKAAGVAEPKLLSYEGLWGSGEEYAYEVLNFADGKRNAQEIRDAVSAEYGPVRLELVVEWLRALEKIGVVSELK